MRGAVREPGLHARPGARRRGCGSAYTLVNDGGDGTALTGHSGDRLTVFCLFFFQAEDGIRDVAVTGVQTCALPICSAEATIPRLPGGLQPRRMRVPVPSPPPQHIVTMACSESLRSSSYTALVTRMEQIGRASCRERV